MGKSVVAQKKMRGLGIAIPFDLLGSGRKGRASMGVGGVGVCVNFSVRRLLPHPVVH